MALTTRLALRHAAVSASPQMRAALRVLALSSGDLGAFVAEELERNPFLEDRSRGRISPPLSVVEQAPAAGPSLQAHVLSQAAAAPLSEADRTLAVGLIGELDEDGYLRADPHALAAGVGVSAARVAAVLDVLRAFTPTGVFACDLADCLGLQMEARGRLDPIAARVLTRLDCVADGGPAKLAAAIGVAEQDVRDVLAELATLCPRPAEAFAAAPAPLPAPDVIITRAPGGGWDVTLNPETAPRVAVDETYYRRVMAGASAADMKFATGAFGRAEWLARTLKRRARTLLRTAGEIAARQDAFLQKGAARLRPLAMSTVAEALKLHPSTISRVVANKLAATPQGMIELRALFCGALSANAEEGSTKHVATGAVRHRIRALIADETAPCNVLSDEAIVAALRRNGIDVARRTVAKYREAMRVGSSRQRRRDLAAATLRAPERTLRGGERGTLSR